MFGHSMMGMEGMEFTINGMTFDPERTDTIVKVGTVEEWEIVNGGGMMMMDFDHPFHIHTNAFQVVSVNDQSPSFSAWRDIVNVPMGGSVRIRIPFQDFPGRTVYHCHILDHEDLGMMAVIEKYSKDNGYTMVLDVSNPNTPVLYASSSIDITQDVISLYDKTSTSAAPPTSAAPAAPKPATPVKPATGAPK